MYTLYNRKTTKEIPVKMRLLKSPPPNRTFEQLKNHYLVEKAIAERLKSASREERKLIYATMYDDLFRQVPDHPRLTRRNDEKLTRLANKERLALVRDFLNPSSVFAEFAPGDCTFAMEAAKYVKTAYGMDISDQRGQNYKSAANFELIIYDGYHLEGIESSSVDILFSDQLIEHIHPEDTKLHFELAYRILKPGGKYVFRTPHAFTGPYDVSQYFSDDPQGFHLKEWTFIEFKQLFKDVHFSQFYPVRSVKGIRLKLPYLYVEACEHALKLLPRSYMRVLAKYLIPSICIVVIK